MFKRNRFVTDARLLVLCLLIPLTMGGCPEFQDDVINAIDAATRGILLDGTTPEEELATAGESIAASAFDLFFDQFRGE